MRKHHATFANFICRFGDNTVMLDRAKEIVLPAFLDDSLVRSYGEKTHFHFYETKLISLNDSTEDTPTLAISGRFIKNTALSREQYLDRNKKLVKDDQSLLSSPSCYFLLILNNHRLVYFPETSHAPNLSAFKATVQQFLRIKYKQHIDEQYKELNNTPSKTQITKKELRKTTPSPQLELIPLVNEEGITEFISRYETLKRIEFKLLKPNDEIDGSELVEELREYLGHLGPKTNKVISENPEGLDTKATTSLINDITSSGNQDITLSGIDTHGNQLRGDNDSFKIDVPITSPPASRDKLDKALLQSFQTLVDDGTIVIGEMPKEVPIKIRSIFEDLN